MERQTDGDTAPQRLSWLRERRITIRSEDRVRHVTLGRGTQIAAAGALAALVVWGGAATVAFGVAQLDRMAIAREAQTLRGGYESRIAALTAERDALRAEADAAAARAAALSERITYQQVGLMDAAENERELAIALETLRARLREAVARRDDAVLRQASLEASLAEAEARAAAVGAAEDDWSATLAGISEALAAATATRDEAVETAAALSARLDALGADLAAAEAQRARMYDQLEDAVRIGLGSLERVFQKADVDIDRMIEDIRRQYAGAGGPFVPAPELPASTLASVDAARVASLMGGLERASLMQIAAAKLPLARPVRSAYRLTSGFGVRRDPRNGRSRMHAGADFASSRGTPIYAAADGVVTYAGWQSGYGKVVKIRHAFGFETVYAHQSRLRVKVGDRVAQNDRIGDMGSSGRVTGVHVHYEIRINGKPVNPLKYIEAARNVL